MSKKLRVVFAGGGTGGHVFPALNMAAAIREKWDVEFLFFGTERGLERIKVPEAGYPIEFIPVAGFQRRLTYKNFMFPWKLYQSMHICKNKLTEFNPDLVIGSGGYVMGPVLKSAQKLGIPTILQEQNSFPGVTTRLLAKSAKLIFLAYPEAKNYLHSTGRIMITGNPIRQINVKQSMDKLFAQFGLDKQKKVILAFGGSQGAASINKALMKMLLNNGLPEGYQLLWQTGMKEIDTIQNFIQNNDIKFVQPLPFINEMQCAYTVADFVVCRAGAMTISELMVAGLASVFVPYPFAAGNHQYKNALALEQKNAALLVMDNPDLDKNLTNAIKLLAQDEPKRRQLGDRIAGLHQPDTLAQMTTAIEQLIGGQKL